MTAEDLFNSALEARYLGKTIAGPSYDSRPFVVTDVRYDQDYDYSFVWFGSDELFTPVDPTFPAQRRGCSVSLHRELPAILDLSMTQPPIDPTPPAANQPDIPVPLDIQSIFDAADETGPFGAVLTTHSVRLVNVANGEIVREVEWPDVGKWSKKALESILATQPERIVPA